MGAFFIYILKSAVCLSLLYLFYQLLLSRETFYRFNRFALLGILFLSLSIPFIELATTQQTEVHQAVQTIEQFLVTTEAMNSVKVVTVQPKDISIAWTQILLFVYLVGILFFIFRNLYSLSRLLLLIKSGKREELEGGIILVVHERKIAPFSWMKYIVISQKDLEEDGKTILIHEMAHLHNRHSIDLFLVDVCIFFQWFNPGAWLLKQELQSIHEYEADETVIKKGVDVKEYQLLLIKKAVGTRLYSMANSFNHSKLKKRITMMLKEKSSPWARLKYVYVLPLAAIAVTAFARPEISEKAEGISAVKVNDLAAIVETKVEKISNDKDSLKQKIAGFPSHMPLAYSADSLVLSDESCVLYSPKIDKMKANGKKPLIFIDGKEEVGDDPLSKISSDNIESISVLQDKAAFEIYGEKGKDGVWLIQSISAKKPINVQVKQDTRIADTLNKLKTTQNGGGNNMRIGSNLFGISGDEEPLFIVDDKEVSQDEFSKISINRIDSFTVLKDKSATAVYGEKGKNGVFSVKLLTDEEYTARKNKSQSQLNAISQTNNALDWVAVSGIVQDEDGNPLQATVTIKGIIPSEVVANKEGHFSLEAPKDTELQVLYAGMVTSTVKVSPKVTVKMNKMKKKSSATSEQKKVLIINGKEVKEPLKEYTVINGKGTVGKDTIRIIGEMVIK